ncbi:hypothetical protein BH09MYX1_BH09MYX1_08160 [soil metagenome]
MKKKLFAIAAALLLTAGTISVAFAEPTDETTHGGASHASKDAAEAEAEGGPPKEMNWADFSKKGQPPFAALLLNFAGLVAIYYFAFRKGVTQGLVDRKIAISKDIESAQGMLRDAKERAKRYQAKLQDVEVDAEQAKATLITAGEAEKNAIAKASTEKVERMKRDADFMVSQEAKQIQKDLLRETVEAAINDAEELISKGISQADQERLAEEFLGSLQTQIASARSSSASRPTTAGGAS